MSLYLLTLLTVVPFFMFVLPVHVFVIVIINANRFCHLQSVIQIRLLDTIHTMTIDVKNEKNSLNVSVIKYIEK